MLKRIAMILLAAAAIAAAQEKAPPPPPPSGAVYRLEYTITETEGTKKVSSRNYTALVEDRKRGTKIRVGTRVPLQTKEGSIQYFDVGTNIDVRLEMLDAASVHLDTTIELSSVIAPEATTARAPVTRNFSNGAASVVPLDKLVTLTTADDPGSNTTIQVQVLVKQVK